MFLHVMTVMNEKASIETTARLLSTRSLIGASLPNLAVFFSRGGELLRAAEVVLDGPKTAVLVCDLRPGLWSLTRHDGETERVRVNAQGTVIFLTGPEGPVQLAYVQP